MPTADFEKRVNETVSNIQASDAIHSRNKELILDYKRDQILNGLKNATLAKNLAV